MGQQAKGVDLLRRAANLSRNTRESAFDGYSAVDCFRMCVACIRSAWDITPDALTQDERHYAAVFGEFSEECIARLEREL